MNLVERTIIGLVAKVAEIERRMDGVVKQGTVHSVDPETGTVEMRLGGTDAEPFLSDKIPYAQTAGGLKVHTPPTPGQQMTVISGSGDFRKGLALPMTWSDQNAAPSDKGDENVVTYGDWRLTLDGDQLVATKGGTKLRLTGNDARVEAGKVVVLSGDVNLGGEGGKRVARIGDHVHVTFGSSSGMHPIVEGSSAVKAID